MIYGDPHKLAFQFDVVKEWNLEGCSWVNGTFAIYIEGKPFLLSTDNVTLNIFANFYGSLAKYLEKKTQEIDTNTTFMAKNTLSYRELYGHFYEVLYGDVDDYCDTEIKVPGFSI